MEAPDIVVDCEGTGTRHMGFSVTKFNRRGSHEILYKTFTIFIISL